MNLQVLGKIFFRSFVLIRIRIVSLHRKDIVKFYHNKLLLGVKEVVVSLISISASNKWHKSSRLLDLPCIIHKFKQRRKI